MALTVLDITGDALREIGVLAAGETCGAADGAAGLAALNRLLDQWAVESLLVHKLSITNWNIVALTQEYNIGTGSTINVIRPSRIEQITFSDTAISATQEFPLAEFNQQAWMAVTDKALRSTYPNGFYYDTKWTTGVSVVALWPVPTLATLVGHVYQRLQVAEFAAVTDTFSLPQGWRRMVVKNLALELAPSYGKTTNELLFRQAIDAKAAVKRSNKVDRNLTFAPDMAPGGGSYDIRTDA